MSMPNPAGPTTPWTEPYRARRIGRQLVPKVWHEKAALYYDFRGTKGNEMAGTYKIVELVVTSPISFAEAVKSGVAEASKTSRHMDWFEVVEERGRIVDGAVHEFQVTIKVGFKIER